MKTTFIFALGLLLMTSCSKNTSQNAPLNGGEKDSILIRYKLLENNDPMVREAMDIEPHLAFDVTLQGKLNNTSYTLYQVHVKEGKIEKKEIAQAKTEATDSIQHFLFASIAEKKDTLRLICKHQEKNDLRINIPTYGFILMETYPTIKPTKDKTIPLIAFTPGAEKIFEIEGKQYNGYDYCGVRNANLHPSKWFETFGIKDYIYFEIKYQE